MWTKKERLKHFWRTRSHLTRFITVGFGIVLSTALFTYLVLYQTENFAIFCGSVMVGSMVGGGIYAVWVLTEP